MLTKNLAGPYSYLELPVRFQRFLLEQTFRLCKQIFYLPEKLGRFGRHQNFLHGNPLPTLWISAWRIPLPRPLPPYISESNR